jgi:carbonic anhydrase
MNKILQGVRTFQSTVFPGQRDLFEHLARKQQAPQALFVTCSDSRVNPNLITQTEPGDLFILRNAGNIIPPYGAGCGGEAATIEYAVAVLKVPSIIVCGHSHCGAMQNLLGPEPGDRLPAVRAWFAHAEATRRILQDRLDGMPRPALVERAVEQNVLVQVENLRTHPSVAAGLCRGDLQVYGWVYRIETGDVLTYDPVQGRFVALGEQQPVPIPPPAYLAPVPAL